MNRVIKRKKRSKVNRIWIVFDENNDTLRCFKSKAAAIRYSYSYFTYLLKKGEPEFRDPFYYSDDSYIDIYVDNSAVGYIGAYFLWE